VKIDLKELGGQMSNGPMVNTPMTSGKHDKVSFEPEGSEDTAQIDDVEMETNLNVQSTRRLRYTSGHILVCS